MPSLGEVLFLRKSPVRVSTKMYLVKRIRGPYLTWFHGHKDAILLFRDYTNAKVFIDWVYNTADVAFPYGVEDITKALQYAWALSYNSGWLRNVETLTPREYRQLWAFLRKESPLEFAMEEF